MNRRTASLSVAILLAILVPPGGLPAQGPENASANQAPSIVPAPVAPEPDLSKLVAVVDVERVLKGYPKARQLREGWKQREAQVIAMLNEGQDQLKKLALEAEGWDRFSVEWMEAQAKLEGKNAELTRSKELQEQGLLIERYKIQETLFLDIDRAIAQLAEKRNLQLVLSSISEFPKEEPLDTRIAKLASRSVLYNRAALDLTEDVINFLKSPDFAGNGGSARSEKELPAPRSGK